MKPTFFARHALLILMAVFFCVPFAMRGARFALEHMKNDVRDWLPSSYDETGELQWFRDHFLGEQFVVVSWKNCHGTEDDAKFKLFLQKILPAIPPSQLREQYFAKLANAPAVVASPTTSNASEIDAEAEVTNEQFEQEQKELEQSLEAMKGMEKEALLAQLQQVYTQAEVHITRGDFIGDELGLYTPHDQPSLYFNWAGQNEKWLKGSGNQWYYILPDGALYRWNGVDAPIAAAGRWLLKQLMADRLTGELVKNFGPLDGPWYYENPRRLRAQLFKTVTCGPGVLHSLTNEEKGVLRGNPDAAMERLQGTLFGPDGQQTCIFLTLTDAAKRDLHQVCGRAMLGKPLGRLYEVGAESGVPMDQLRLGGPPIDNIAIDEEGTITLVRLVGLSIVLGLGLSYACFRSISATIMVFFVGGISALLSVACVWWLGGSMDAIMMSMPSLVYVLGLSGAVHLMNYYQQAVEEHGVHGAAERAVAHAWKPAILCNLTTAIGLISLYTSEIVPIRKFGTFSAIAVMAMLVIVFTYLPAALQLWPQIPKQKVTDAEPSWLENSLAGFWNMLGGWIIRNHWLVSVGCTLFIAVVGYGVIHIQTSVNLLKMFDGSAKIIGDYQWLEKNLGRLVPMEVVVKVGRETWARPTAASSTNVNPQVAAKDLALKELLTLNFLGRMEMASRVQNSIEREFGPKGSDEVGKAMSAATFAPILPAVTNGLSAFSERRATNKKLEEHRPDFLKSDYLREDREDGSELWRISVRLAASKKVDYGSFVHDLKLAVQPVLDAYADRETMIRGLAERRFKKLQASGVEMEASEIARGINPALAKILVINSEMGEGSAKERGEKVRWQTLLELMTVARMKLESIPATDESLTPEKLASYDAVLFTPSVPTTLRNNIVGSAPFFLEMDDRAGEAAGQTSLSAVYTGVVPIVYKAQRALLESLVESTVWSFLTITPLMMFVSRNIGAGAVAMLPNVLPVFVVFGFMGWFGVEVDVGSMMTASIALGVAVDDTIHYLSWFREELDHCGNRHEAILRTYNKCATPTFQAALISGLGLSIFAFSTFTPTQRFGYLMLSILWAGVVAELIYFPALLAGPLGMVFKPNPANAKKHVPAPTTPEISSEEADGAGVVKFPLIKPHMLRHDDSHGMAQHS